MASVPLEEALRAWSHELAGDPALQQLAVRTVLALIAEWERLAWNKPRGRTTLSLWHPEGEVRKAFLQDREI